MQQIAQYQDGRLEIQEVPAPLPPPGGILVRTTHSVISPGTEKMKVEQANMSLLQKARARPDQVRKVLDTARTLGWKNAIEKVRNRLSSPTPLGYSAAGVVVGVDAGNTRFRVGDRVACAGAECAHHAEILAVPDLLAAKVPEGVENWEAAYTTMAAIAMHAVRQSDVRVGERVLVVGQGLVGLLATGILRAAGARVLAVDLDARRLEAALGMGAERAVSPAGTDLQEEVREWSEGHGADAALLCVGGKDRRPVDGAVAALRDRGTMVIVGILDATLEWKELYAKELQVRYSRSYGPGRYDRLYEWGGVDYPAGYVRWTEQRNFEACLALMRSGALDVGVVTSRKVRFEDALSVYDDLVGGGGGADIGVVLEYGAGDGSGKAERVGMPVEGRVEKGAATLSKPVVRLHAVGAGNFVRTMLLPHLRGKIAFGTVANGTSLSARHVKRGFGFGVASGDGEAVLAGAEGEAVIVGTRHHLHAPMVVAGLGADAHVFVEKPLCLTREELAEIDAAEEASEGSVMVGFNRRFAPAAEMLKKALAGRPGPISISYRVFAGALKPDHWYADAAESGGRVLGEACHFFDFFCYLAGSAPVRVFAQPVWPGGGRQAFPDSVAAQVEFADGSSGQLIYSAEGDHAHPKESLTVFASGLVATCEDFRKLTICENRKKAVTRHSSKGHAEEMAAWLRFLGGLTRHPLPYGEARRSMALTFDALESIRGGCAVRASA